MQDYVKEKVLMTRNEECRACKGRNLARVFSFGPTPPANAFLRREDLGKPELWFPLDVYFCQDCTLLQLLDVVSPDLLFRDYVYVSSTAPSFVAHFESFARAVHSRFGLTPASLAVDIGSNDGILLSPFKKIGVRVLGIDPAVKIAARATAEGIETLPFFFNPALAKKLGEERGRASVVTGTNVFAHINGWHDLLEGVKNLLAPDGVFIVEAPYAVDFLEKNLFDTVYHEHLSYIAIRPLMRLFPSHGMEIFDVQKVPVHGGTVRIFVKHKGAAHPRENAVQRFLDDEGKRGLGELKTYLDFGKKVEENKKRLSTLLHGLKAEGKRIAGYGAPAKGNTLLNYFKIGRDILDYIVDDSVWKQGLYTPGTHIPVVAREELVFRPPDYVLILAWNFAEEIMEKLGACKSAGGKFIIPVPEPQVV